jgi:thioredoxin-related protein
MVSAITPTLINATNLYEDGKIAKKKSLPILMMFSINDCPYCEKVKNDILKPMLRSGDYENKTIIRHLNTSKEKKIIDFSNKEKSAQELALFYGISFFPTVILVNNKGQPLSGHIVGIANEDYYWYDLDLAIMSAMTAFKTEKIYNQ